MVISKNKSNGAALPRGISTRKSSNGEEYTTMILAVDAITANENDTEVELCIEDYLREVCNVTDYKIIRADWRFDFFEANAYDQNAKLAYVLMRLLQMKKPESKKNAGITLEFDQRTIKSMFAKSAGFEAEFYNKRLKQPKNPACEARLEFRLKNLDNGKLLRSGLDSILILLSDIEAYWDKLKEEIEKELVSEWEFRKRFDKSINMTCFLLERRFKLLDRDHAKKVLSALGSKNPEKLVEKISRKEEGLQLLKLGELVKFRDLILEGL